MKEMTLAQHFTEMKNYLKSIGLFLIFTSIIIFFFSEYLILQLLSYYGLENIIVTSPTAYILMKLYLSVILGLIITIPYFMYKLNKFLALKQKNLKKVVLYSAILAFLGAIFGFTIFSKYTIEYFLIVPEMIMPMWTLDSVIKYVLFITVSFAIIAQLILIIPLLVKNNIIKKSTLKNSRGAIFVGLLILASILTPPDPWTQIAMIIPMYACFETGILLS